MGRTFTGSCGSVGVVPGDGLGTAAEALVAGPTGASAADQRVRATAVSLSAIGLEAAQLRFDAGGERFRS